MKIAVVENEFGAVRPSHLTPPCYQACGSPASALDYNQTLHSTSDSTKLLSFLN
jgi:hypothetical protein